MSAALNVIKGDGDKTTRFWTCDACGRRDKWGPSWMWFGSYGAPRSPNSGTTVESVACSSECRRALHPGARILDEDAP